MNLIVLTLLLLGGLLVLFGVHYPHPQRPRSPRDATRWLLAIGAFLGGAVGGLILTGLPIVALLAALLCSTVPHGLRQRRAAQRARQRRASWPAFLDDVTSAVRAGLGLPEALIRAGTSSGFADQWDVFETTYRRTSDFDAALRALQHGLADPVFDQVAQTFIVTRTVGGTQLTTVLRSLTGFVRDDLHLRGELEARQSWTVNSARMAVAAPWVVLLMLASRPSTIAAYSNLNGALLLAGVAAASAIAYAAMLRIARLPEVSG